MSTISRIAATLLLFLFLPWMPPLAQAGPRTKIKECKCSVKTPKNWWIAEFRPGTGGLDYLVTASPNEHPTNSDIPSVNFLRQKLDDGVSATAEKFLAELGAQFEGQDVGEPKEAKLGKTKAASLDVTIQRPDGVSVSQRYYATVRSDEVYVLILTWQNEEELQKLMESVKSVKFRR